MMNVIMLETLKPPKPLIPECIDCGNQNIRELEIEHMWLVSMIGRGRQMDPNLDLPELQAVIGMSENMNYICPDAHMRLDRLKTARFFGYDVCERKKCPIVTPKVAGTKKACKSFEYCNASDDEILKLSQKSKRVKALPANIMDPTRRGDPVALAQFIKDSYPYTKTEDHMLTQVNGLILVQEAYLEAVAVMTQRETGLDEDLTTAYVRSGFVVAEHIEELKERRTELIADVPKSYRSIIVPQLPRPLPQFTATPAAALSY